jgi:Type II secretion system (T2SS), protein G
MKAHRVAVAAAFFIVVSSTVPAGDPPEAKDLVALEKKLVGAWIGQGACDGRMVFQADGTYHVTGWMVGQLYGTGTWKIEWSALPPTLVLSPTQMELAIDDTAKPSEVFLRTLNDKALNFEYPNPQGAPAGKHLRGTELDDVKIRLDILQKVVQRYRASNGKLPANLKALVDAKVLSSKLLVDPWGKEFHYEIAGKKNQGERPDIWTEMPDKKVIGNWMR